MAKIKVVQLSIALAAGGQMTREFPDIFAAAKDIAVGSRMAKALTGSDMFSVGDVVTITAVERDETPEEEADRQKMEAEPAQYPVCKGCGKRHPMGGTGMRVVDLSKPGAVSADVEALLREAGLLGPGQSLGPRPSDETGR